MQSHVLRLGHDFQVFWAVVTLVAVTVMNDFTLNQGSAKHLFSDASMLVASSYLAVTKAGAFVPFCAAIILLPST